MKRPTGPDIQRAIQFLSTAELAEGGETGLPGRPDYEFLARHACGLGHDITPGAVREAFRRIMRARLVASHRLSNRGADRWLGGAVLLDPGSSPG